MKKPTVNFKYRKMIPFFFINLALSSQWDLHSTYIIIIQTIYDNQVTETESTELAITFRGKPIVTTILDSSVKEITATEFSTETKVDTQLVTRTVANPVIQNTQLPQLSALALVIIMFF